MYSLDPWLMDSQMIIYIRRKACNFSYCKLGFSFSADYMQTMKRGSQILYAFHHFHKLLDQ